MRRGGKRRLRAPRNGGRNHRPSQRYKRTQLKQRRRSSEQQSNRARARRNKKRKRKPKRETIRGESENIRYNFSFRLLFSFLSSQCKTHLLIIIVISFCCYYYLCVFATLRQIYICALMFRLTRVCAVRPSLAAV